MDHLEREFGKPNPNAPAELARFAFLIGSWRCDTRATYTNISETHFTWRRESSNDGDAWNEFMVIEAYRSTQ
jgi:hypothetical protein